MEKCVSAVVTVYCFDQPNEDHGTLFWSYAKTNEPGAPESILSLQKLYLVRQKVITNSTRFFNFIQGHALFTNKSHHSLSQVFWENVLKHKNQMNNKLHSIVQNHLPFIIFRSFHKCSKEHYV